eukprot:TRINITY_DN20855_c0_g1_i1.p1 TRINITY_DN20855_c0_g1~~TRINITY_DN20855_c0_g1_i1.p1  ORF type:complete len:106 (+),score=7.01 TRINITY_DN20855_c0_g1_i1:33-320(+)
MLETKKEEEKVQKLLNKMAFRIQAAWHLSNQRVRISQYRKKVLRQWAISTMFLCRARLFLLRKRNRRANEAALTIQLAFKSYQSRLGNRPKNEAR